MSGKKNFWAKKQFSATKIYFRQKLANISDKVEEIFFNYKNETNNIFICFYIDSRLVIFYFIRGLKYYMIK